MEKHKVHSGDKMLGRKRFLMLLLAGGVTLAIISLSLQFCECKNLSYTSCLVVEPNPVSQRPPPRGACS